MRLLGLDVGGTKCAVTLGECAGDALAIVQKVAFPTPSRWQDAVRQLIDAARAMGAAHACGISCGGPLDAQNGLIQSPPNLPGWDQVPIVRLVQDALGLPTFLENDANACALAEWRWGAGRGVNNLAFLTFGTGLGAGLILNGRLVRGACGNAGEVGHLRLAPFGPAGYGKIGSFEGFCSGGGLAQLGATYAREAIQRGVQPLFDANAPTARTIAEAARAHCPVAQRTFDTCGEMLGMGLGLLIDIINPERIVIGSIFTRCEDLLRIPMTRALERECLPASRAAVSIVPATLGESIGDYAALGSAAYAVGGEEEARGTGRREDN
ncbi:MAG: ROK family protein [Clostridia bacterium]